MKKQLLGAVALLAVALAGGQAQAEAGDILVRARIITVAPTDGDNTNGGILPSIPTGSVNVNEAYVPEVDLTYFFTNNLAVETICCVARHSIRGSRAIAGLGTVGKTWVLPATVNLQYHLAPDASFRPYIGAGINYSFFFGEKETASLRGAVGNTIKLNVKDKFGVDFQAGMDIPLQGNWFLNADFKYYILKPTATLTQGAVPAQSIKIKLNPIVAGLGIGYKF